MKKIIIEIILLSGSFIFLSSCEKEAGEGGSSSIYGKVYVKDYNSTFTILQEEYYATEQDVYIIYGDDKSYGDKVKTSYNGTYEFRYLRPGTYHIYAFSKDSTLQTTADIGVVKDVTVTKNKQTVEVPDIIIFK
jgi:hypothetical protein